MTTRRRLPAFFDRPPAVSFSLSRYTLSSRGRPKNLHRVSFRGLVFSTAHHLILIAPFKVSVHELLAFLLPPAEFTSARTRRTRALGAISRPASSLCFSVAKAVRWLLSISNFKSVHPGSFLILENECTSLSTRVRNFAAGEALAEDRQNVPWRHRVLNASAIRTMDRSTRFTIETTPLYSVESRRGRKSEKQLHPDRIRKSPNAK